MKRYLMPLVALLLINCKQTEKITFTAQEIVDESIKDSGGALYGNHNTSFVFRDRTYISEVQDGQKILKRLSHLDSVRIMDLKTNLSFKRFINDTLVALPDSIANRYANSVNSVHYFARLPLGLNDPAVRKELLGTESIKGKDYFKIKVTFDQKGGGDDFDDIYVYWFNKETFKPDYLAYDFHVDGGGQRFREAFNERYINGIRFVDYNNYKPKTKDSDILDIGQSFDKDALELLSKIELKDIKVTEN
ncbi:DUF6503 family protein [Flagellimonas meishanensis]|uniref:DUF6503 family protein n=1 Tax=Flagellimonas meishanensis TaxID=2873264 RepID=UPI001CA78CFF|nr:DUF6503 family protein [[Muricauda] meishanensis]